jgi:translation initiation factor 5B
MHGLEKQTLESIDLLRKRKTPFIVALNKIDRMHSFKSEEFRSSKISLENQHQTVMDEYEKRRDQAFLQFNEIGMNIVEYWNNTDPRTYISAVPTSAMTGEGIPDILGMIVKCTQKMLKKQITQRNAEFQCTVLEVKKISGVGTTVDVVLVNGKLKVGDTIVLAGFNGPIVTKIRALLTPQPMKEIRVKGEYIHHQELYGAMGIKISAPDLDYALAGGELYRANSEEDIEYLCEEIQDNMLNFAEKYVNPKEEGVCVQASTLGSLEALLEFLKTSKIPVCSINIGELFKKDVMKALKNITGERVRKEFATILAFDVKVDKEAREYSEENGIKIFEADIIYHLFDQFTEYVEICTAERKKADGAKAVFPCVLEIIQGNIFHVSSPILIGVNVKAGVLRVGTPLCIPDKDNLRIGVVSGIQKGGKDVTQAREIDGGVSVKIDNDKHIMAGKSFTEDNQLASLITRDSIEALKIYFKDEMTKDDWKLIIKLKKVFAVI